MSKKSSKTELDFDELKQNLENCEDPEYKIVSQQPAQPSIIINGDFVELPFAATYRQVLLEKSGFPKKWQYIASGSKIDEEFLKFLAEKYKEACLKEKIRGIDTSKLGGEEEEENK